MQMIDVMCAELYGRVIFLSPPVGVQIGLKCHTHVNMSICIGDRALFRKKAELITRFSLEDVIADVRLPDEVISDQRGDILGEFGIFRGDCLSAMALCTRPPAVQSKVAMVCLKSSAKCTICPTCPHWREQQLRT